MDYGDIMRERISRVEMIEKIKKHFRIDSDNISNACSAAGVRYPDEPIQYFFLGECIRRGLDLEGEDDAYEAVHAEADYAVPHQTYVVWRLWIEFGYETDAYQDYGIEPQLNNLENVAQVQLNEYASRIISYFGER